MSRTLRASFHRRPSAGATAPAATKASSSFARSPVISAFGPRYSASSPAVATSRSRLWVAVGICRVCQGREISSADSQERYTARGSVPNARVAYAAAPLSRTNRDSDSIERGRRNAHCEEPLRGTWQLLRKRAKSSNQAATLSRHATACANWFSLSRIDSRDQCLITLREALAASKGNSASPRLRHCHRHDGRGIEIPIVTQLCG